MPVKPHEGDCPCAGCTIWTLRAALIEISLGYGAFNRDKLTHANNCIEDMQSIALKALGDSSDSQT